MHRLRFLYFAALSLIALTAAHAGSLTADDRKQFDPISAGISAATEVTLFEGLPHQMFERDRLATELKTQQTVQLHGYPFYKRPLLLSAEDAAALRRLLTNKASFETFGGEKFCGGFHPDYSIAWVQGGQTIHVLVCFGCHEFKLFGAEHELRTDSDDAAMKQIEAILRKYHAQRPKPRNG
jgi:hypothetical protein